MSTTTDDEHNTTANETPTTDDAATTTTTGQRSLPPVVRRLERARADGTTDQMPVCVIVVGMAGSGKTTLLTQMQRSLEDKAEERQKARRRRQRQEKQAEKEPSSENDDKVDDDDEDDEEDQPLPAYCINLDPATLETPYDASIDIRDTVNYKQVMEQHRLGPNGAIMTSLNLFATKFDQVLEIVEKRAFPDEYGSDDHVDDDVPEFILVDTPGQIEAFTWSASGQIIGEALASALPTVLVFVVDTVRCAASTNTFMSNMLYACSMLYRTRLPLVVCFNKTDVVSHEFCTTWMRDHEAFQAALDEQSATAGFYGSLTRSLSLVLDEFYSNFANAVGVSAVTGGGMDEFWTTVRKAATEDFAVDYVEDLKLRVAEREARQRAIARSGTRRLQRDLAAEDEDEDRRAGG